MSARSRRQRLSGVRPNGFQRQGLSLLEVIIATLITGVLLVATMKTVGASLRAGLLLSDRSRALLLAADLAAEILQLAYADPQGGTGLAADTGETGGTRAAYDDVDDYNGLNETPPIARDGVSSGLTGWKRTVLVEYVDPANLATTVGSDQSAKRITIKAFKGTKELESLVTVRLNSGQ